MSATHTVSQNTRKLLLQALAEGGGGLTYRELAKQIGRSLSVTHDAMNQLLADGLLVRERCSKCGHSGLAEPPVQLFGGRLGTPNEGPT